MGLEPLLLVWRRRRQRMLGCGENERHWSYFIGKTRPLVFTCQKHQHQSDHSSKGKRWMKIWWRRWPARRARAWGAPAPSRAPIRPIFLPFGEDAAGIFKYAGVFVFSFQIFAISLISLISLIRINICHVKRFNNCENKLFLRSG